MGIGNLEVESLPLFLAGEWKPAAAEIEVRSPYDGQLVGTVARAGKEELEAAIQAAERAAEPVRRLPAHRRAAMLRQVAAAIRVKAEEFALTIAREAAKPVRQARVEVQRAVFIFEQAAEEAGRTGGETLNLDVFPAGEGRQGLVRRFPVGPLAAITPFNFPLHLVAHKLAPAMAAGCPVVLKPASQTPLSALKLAGLVAEAGWPAGGLSVLPLPGSQCGALVADERLRMLTFTGSPAVGWNLKSAAGRKKVTLELGGNAAIVVHDDADLEYAVSRAVPGGYTYSGQTCISVQRIYVQQKLYNRFLEMFTAAVAGLKTGDPLNEATDVSALINPQETARVAEWLAEARAAGARLATGGQVVEGIIQPVVITGARADLSVNCREIFAPVTTVQPYGTFAEALTEVNRSDYGLQAGIFTADLKRAFQAFDQLEVGGVIINDVSSYRVDHMPYGGVKMSGFGREGIRYAVEEMTEPRLLVINLSN